MLQKPKRSRISTARRLLLIGCLMLLPALFAACNPPNVPWNTHAYCNKQVPPHGACPNPNGAVLGWFGANRAVFAGSATTARVCARIDIYSERQGNARVRTVRDCGISSVEVTTPQGYEDRTNYWMIATVENGTSNSHRIYGTAFGYRYG
jgi:hypothetical protein